jgi:hypothetical protein
MDSDGNWVVYETTSKGHRSFRGKISLGQKALAFAGTPTPVEAASGQYRLHGGCYYGHNPMVLQLKKAFPDSCIYLSLHRVRDEQGNSVVQGVNSVWEVGSLKGLKKALAYFEKHPPFSEKGRLMNRLLPIFVELKDQRAEPEVLEQFYRQVYLPARNKPLASEYLRLLREEVAPADSLKRELEDRVLQKQATWERIKLQEGRYLPAERAKPSRYIHRVLKLEQELETLKEALREAKLGASGAHRKRRRLEQTMDALQRQAEYSGRELLQQQLAKPQRSGSSATDSTTTGAPSGVMSRVVSVATRGLLEAAAQQRVTPKSQGLEVFAPLAALSKTVLEGQHHFRYFYTVC